MLNLNQKAYLAGFLDGDGSIYVRLKPNPTYKYGYQVAPYAVLFQSQKMEEILEIKERVNNKNDFRKLADVIDRFRNLNYSKKRKHRLTP